MKIQGITGLNRYLFILAAALSLTVAMACATPSVTDNISDNTTDNITSTTSSITDNVTDNQTAQAVSRPIPEDSMPRISIADLKQKMDSSADILIVDTRHKDEYSIDHIKGAVSAPLDDIIAGKWQPPAGKELILYCA